MARLEQLEMRVKTQENVGDTEKSTTAAWRPRHVIIGGWPQRTSREVIERESRKRVEQLNVDAFCLAPGAPRRHREIAKVKIQGSDTSGGRTSA